MDYKAISEAPDWKYFMDQVESVIFKNGVKIIKLDENKLDSLMKREANERYTAVDTKKGKKYLTQNPVLMTYQCWKGADPVIQGIRTETGDLNEKSKGKWDDYK